MHDPLVTDAPSVTVEVSYSVTDRVSVTNERYMNEKSSTLKTKLRCGICGKRFRKGGTRYRINLEIISDFNGYIEDVSKKPEDYLEKKIAKILEQTKDMSEKELKEEVYLKRNWLVCVNCREKFVKFLKDL